VIPEPDEVEETPVDESNAPTTHDESGYPREGARERDIDKTPEEIGWVRWISLRPALLAYFLLGLAILIPLVLVSINYGRVGAQNDRIQGQADQISRAVEAIQASREDGIRNTCEANNAQNAAIFGLLNKFRIPTNDPRLAPALKALRPQDCEQAVIAARPKVPLPAQGGDG
jgi:hypothetical protein